MIRESSVYIFALLFLTAAAIDTKFSGAAGGATADVSCDAYHKYKVWNRKQD